jgi:hypothetical protein
MARPKKQVEPIVEETAVDVQPEVTFAKPEPIIIIPEPIESIEVVMLKKKLLDEFEEAKALLKKKENELAEKEKMLNSLATEEISVEEPAVEEVIEDVAENNLEAVDEGFSFEVFDSGVYVETVSNNSEKLLNYLESNRKQLDEWIEELSQVPSDPNDLIFINFGAQQRIYRTYDQYFTQNGYAPRPPAIKSWMEYYKRLHNPITDEEIAVELKGKLRYSFNPIK